MTRGTARRAVIAAAVAGVVIRLAFGLFYWVGKPLTHDEREYLRLARNLAAGRGFVDDPRAPAQPEVLPAEQFGRAPLYPAFLAIATLGGRTLPPTGEPDRVPTSVKIAQALLGGIGVLLVARIAGNAAGPAASIAAAWLAAVHPPLVWIAAYALTEGFYWVLALAAVAVLAPVTDRALEPRSADLGPATEPVHQSASGFRRGASGRRLGSRQLRSTDVRQALLGGVVAGLGALTRPATIVFIALVAGWLVWRRRTAMGAVVVLGALAVILPWTMRNVRTYGRVVLIASEGGVTFWTGNHPLSPGEGDMAANPDIKRANQDLRRRYPHLTPEEMEPIYYSEAFAYIAAHPLEWVGLLARKALYTWLPIGPSVHAALASVLQRVGRVVRVLLVVACLGFGRLRRAPTPPRALWLLAASLVLVCLIFLPQERFRIPVMDPVLIVCAAAWCGSRAFRTQQDDGAQA